MRRVLIVGCAGAGKTTFALALAEKIGLPLVHLDQIYWCGQWEHLSREEFDNALQKELEKPEWIIDGNFDRTLPHRLQYCDTVFFFDLPKRTCLWGITNRVFQNYGKSRQDMGGNCPERFDRNKWQLYRTVWQFRKKNRHKYYELLKEMPNVVIFRSRKQAKQYLREVVE